MNLETFDFAEIEQMITSIFGKQKINFVDLIKGLISGDEKLSLEEIGDWVWNQVFYEIEASKSGLAYILVLVFVAAVFANFSGMLKETQVAEISFSMIYMLIITICLSNFRILISNATENIEQLTGFVGVLGPVYFLAVTLATGSITSVSFYQILLLLIYLSEVLILNILLPMTQIYLVVRILSDFSKELHLSKFAELIELIISWTLKTITAAVFGVNLIQRLISPAIDTVKRGALTIIGDITGGTTDVVIGTAVLIKNGIGVAGMIVCLMICLTPVIQMGISAFMYQAISALIQPISDKRMVNCISSMAEACKMILKIVLTVAMLFLLTIAVVASTTGGA